MLKKILVIGITLASCGTVAGQTVPPRFTMQWEEMAKTIVERLALKEGETFLTVAHPGLFDELIPHLRYQVMRSGAVDLGVMDVMGQPVPESWSESTLLAGGKASRERLREMLKGVDASIMLPGANPGQPVYAAIQDNLRDGLGRTIHFHWLENGSAFVLPGQPLPARHLIEATYQRAVLDSDYRAIGQHQERFESAMRENEIHVRTPLGTDLAFRIGDRPVTRQDGDASAARTTKANVLIDREIELPSGALRVAPIEESVQGRIVFPPSQWGGRPVHGLTLDFENGKVVRSSAESGIEAARREANEAGEAGKSFREFALGFNPLLTIPDENPWIPYYGYGAGVIRLSLGDNSELGGKVTGGYVRWNFFPDATVTVAGDVWVRDGKLVK